MRKGGINERCRFLNSGLSELFISLLKNGICSPENVCDLK